MDSCPPRLVYAQVGGSRLGLRGGQGCLQSQFRLVSAQGDEKYAANLVNGDGWLDLHTPAGVPIAILPGDRILTTSGGETRESQVPPLTLEIDPHSHRVSGQAPPGGRLEIAMISIPFNGPFPVPASVIVTATQEGTYSADLLGDYGYHAGDTLRASLLDSPVEYYAIAALPRLQVQLYDWWAQAWLEPLSPYTLTLTTPITTGQVSGYAPSDGSINTTINSLNYGDLQVTPGSRLRLESSGVATELDVPLLTAVVDLESAGVSGQAPPDSHLRLDFQGNSGNMVIISTQEITASAQGQFMVDFPNIAPLDSASGSLTYISPAGHEAYTRFQSPRLTVTLDEACVEGIGPNPGGEVTLVLSSSDGSFSQSLTTASYVYDAGFNLCFDRLVRAGDHLELSAEGESILTYTAQPLTARHDFSIQAVLGWAPPDSSPKVFFNVALGTDISRRPWLNPDGSFGMDTSDLILSIGDTGRLVVVDARGNATERIFIITGYPIYLPSVYESD